MRCARVKPAASSSDDRRRWREWRLQATVLFIGAFGWNIASPIKAWALERFGFAATQISINVALSWTSFLDYDIVQGIYSNAGVELQLPEGEPMRFINMHLDFLNFYKSKTWAPQVGRHHDDEMSGHFCRTALRYRPDEMARAVRHFQRQGFSYWNTTTSNYVREEQQCSTSEVAEALLCLKGYNATQFVNLDYRTKLNMSDNATHAGLARYQELMFPDLARCLERRGFLVERDGHTEGLLQLAEELAQNYSLDPHNIAGAKSMLLPNVQYSGFLDLSGSWSGRRTIQLSGVPPGYDQEFTIVPLTAAREILWICAFNPTTFFDCIDSNATIASPGFVTAAMTQTWAAPLVPNPRFKLVDQVVNLSEYSYVYEQHIDDPVRYVPMQRAIARRQ